MMSGVDILKTPIGYLNKIGPMRAKLLEKELKIVNYGDLAIYLPYRYVDRSRIYNVSELQSTVPALAQIKVRFMKKEILGQGRAKRLQITASDESGTVSLVWFNFSSWMQESLKIGETYIVFGKPDFEYSIVSFVHPEVESAIKFEKDNRKMFMVGVYSITERLSKGYITSKTIFTYQKELWKTINGHVNETLPEYLIRKLSLLSRNDALYNAHFPENEFILQQALYRLKFEELFSIQLSLLRYKLKRHQSSSGYVFKTVGYYFNKLYSSLPFSLTESQKQVIREIRKDMMSSHQMNRLLQGDVGSGKTIVALLTAMIAADNGFQTAIMVPTEILAEQHYQGISKMCSEVGIHVSLLTGSTKKQERKEINDGLLSGSIDILIGTHALIEDNVQFRNLGYVVIDEQHRFGVEQRGKIWHKGFSTPHVLVMTATPIPRTLAMTIYGDLDISVIDSKPVGRKPIITKWGRETDRYSVYNFIKGEIEKGHQIYIVYPLIKESEKLDYKNLYQGVQDLELFFPHPKYSNVVVHGQMEPKMKEFGMDQFKKGNAQILVSTTVIEVGVDVPNATVILIESAERFGLAQLHQLRGRVGRSSLQSYCILLTSEKVSSQTAERMKAMERTNDGFELSELDMKQRGSGDLDGIRQSGQMIQLRAANPVKDVSILQLANSEASNILQFDPSLEHPDNRLLHEMVENTKPPTSEFDLASIS